MSPMPGTAQGDLLTAPVPELIRRLAIPASIGFFFNTMYNVVDTFWAGRLSTDALAALSLSFPVFFVLIAMGSGFSTGATALIGNALGRGDRREAAVTAAQGLVLGLLLMVLVMTLGYLSVPSLFRLLGASDAVPGDLPPVHARDPGRQRLRADLLHAQRHPHRPGRHEDLPRLPDRGHRRQHRAGSLVHVRRLRAAGDGGAGHRPGDHRLPGGRAGVPGPAGLAHGADLAQRGGALAARPARCCGPSPGRASPPA